MGWVYDDKELITKQDYIDQLNEIEAYRSLEGQPFDFGTGLIQNDLSYGTEEVYWEMDVQDLEESILWWDYSRPKNYKKKPKRRKYKTKDIDKSKIEKLSKQAWYIAYYYEKENRYIRCYYSGRKRYAKWCSDRAVRNSNDFPLKGGGYRKVYDYWWTVF